MLNKASNLKIILIIFLGSVFSNCLANNTIAGYVYSQNTGEPLPFANIILQGTTIGSVSNINGQFIIKNVKEGNYKIIASYSGYLSEERLIEVYNDMEIVFRLEETSYDINTVVITGTRTERTLRNVPILTNVISKSEIESTGSTNIMDALSLSLPNINFNSSVTGPSMQLAGLEAKYTVFLIDGEKISGETNGNIDYNRLKTVDIERIEIIKGASGILYGSNAIGSVVNIITKKPGQAVETSFGTRYSKYNEFDRDANIAFILKNFSSKTNFFSNSTDGYDLTPASIDERTQEAFKSKSLKQKFEYKASEKLNFEAAGNYYDRERFDSDLIPIHKKDYDYTYNIKSAYRFNTENSISAIWHSDMYITKDVEELFDNKETATYENISSNARLSGTFKVFNKNTLSTGIEYLQDKLYSNRIEGEEKQSTNLIAYAQDEIEFCSYFTAIAGLRANLHSEYGFNAIPQISTMYKLSAMKFRLGYSMGYRSPSMKEMYMSFSPVPVIEIFGNTDLIPETARYYTFSAEYSKPILNASLSVYQNNIKNMITEVQDLVDPRIWVYNNINNVSVNGVDFNLRARLKYGFSVNASYSYTDSEDKTSGSQMLGTSKNNAGLMIQHKFSRKKYSLSTNLRASYKGEVPFEEMDDITGDITSKLYKAHTIWNLTTLHKIHSGIFLTIGVNNIF
ncbi:MAG: TonB-dependent receptor, partial [Bacteroidales bacterium]|nr:TonB-dependent receptor [Bacteroidales bacterium]